MRRHPHPLGDAIVAAFGEDVDRTLDDTGDMCRVLAALGVDESRESDRHVIHSGCGGRIIACNEWDVTADVVVWCNDYETRGYGVAYRIGVGSKGGHLKPFTSEFLEFGGPYNDNPAFGVDVDIRIPDSELATLKFW